MTLLFQRLGQTSRRCDSTCYNGKGAACRCVCGGKNHGVGLEAARQNVREIFLPRLEELNLKAIVRQEEFDFEVKTA